MSAPVRVLLLRNRSGIACVIADQPVEVYEIDFGRADDRVYRLSEDGALVISAGQVDELLADEVVSHTGDGRDDLAPTRRQIN